MSVRSSRSEIHCSRYWVVKGFVQGFENPPEGVSKMLAFSSPRDGKTEYRCIQALPVYIAGADDAKVPPVPIPNTVVKLGCAENTWLATTRENR